MRILSLKAKQLEAQLKNGVAYKKNNVYTKYDRFNLDNLENDECIANFRFEKEDLWQVADALALPRDGFTSLNGTRSGAIEALCVFLRRHCYPCTYLDLIILQKCSFLFIWISYQQ